MSFIMGQSTNLYKIYGKEEFFSLNLLKISKERTNEKKKKKKGKKQTSIKILSYYENCLSISLQFFSFF